MLVRTMRNILANSLLPSVCVSESQDTMRIRQRSSGKLLEKISIAQTDRIRHLKLSGRFNGIDMAFIRKMKGLETLDMEEAYITGSPSSDMDRQYFPSERGHIPPAAFRKMTSLRTVILPTSTVQIDERAFDGCTSLTDVRLSPGLRTIGYAAFRNTALQKLSLPGSIILLEEQAFTGCRQLKELTLESGKQGMEWKGGMAFALCPIEELDLQRNLKYDDYCELENPSTLKRLRVGKHITAINISLGTNIEEIVCLCKKPPHLAYRINAGCTVKVPARCYEAYWLHPVWGKLNLQRLG